MAIKNILFADFETFYDKKAGFSLNCITTPEYILDPRFAVHLCAVYDIRWTSSKIILPHELPDFLRQYDPRETMACSHNALFDLSILSWRYRWVPALLQDTLGMSRALLRLPKNSLGKVLEHLGLGHKGDFIGKVDGLSAEEIRRRGWWSEYCRYAMSDVEGCARIYFKLLRKFPREEQKIMDLVLRCAVQPKLNADLALLDWHLQELRKRKKELLVKCGYEKAQLMSQVQFKLALEELGVEIKYKPGARGPIPQFAKTDPFMEELAEHEDYRVQVLTQARLAHKSTIEETRSEKFLNIGKLPWGNGTLLPVALRYAGAHTNRLSGEWGLNMQNLPRDRSKSRLRQALRAPPGSKIVTADLSQIEARLVAWLAGQNDLLEEFRAGQDVYANFASFVFLRNINKKADPKERFVGKTGVLGLGYGCGADRFCAMVFAQARQYGIELGDLFDWEMADRTVHTYRRKYSHIRALWGKLDRLLATVLNNSLPQTKQLGPVTIRSGGVDLPNGMSLIYDIGDNKLYGAKLLENIVQALARIVVMQAALRLNRLGLRFVLQAHDELVFLVPNGNVTKAKMIISQEMVRVPAWAPGLPLAAEIGVADNYGDAK